MRDLADNERSYVAKFVKAAAGRREYFEEVLMSEMATALAADFDAHSAAVGTGAPCVRYAVATVIEFLDGPYAGRVAGVEPFLGVGDFRKHNNNIGWVTEEAPIRVLPQAFSHYTATRSGGEALVVDVQGVDNAWTDPQIHTSSSVGLSVGNHGGVGVTAFFRTHTCSALCHKLGLDTTEGKGLVGEWRTSGTGAEPKLMLNTAPTPKKGSRTRISKEAFA
jgi:hypothetical protein